MLRSQPGLDWLICSKLESGPLEAARMTRCKEVKHDVASEPVVFRPVCSFRAWFFKVVKYVIPSGLVFLSDMQVRHKPRETFSDPSGETPPCACCTRRAQAHCSRVYSLPTPSPAQGAFRHSLVREPFSGLDRSAAERIRHI